MSLEASAMPPSTEAACAEARLRAMGGDAHVLVTGPHAHKHLITAQRRIDELERRWSRFLDCSEVVRANRAAGSAKATLLSPDTVAVLERARLGWQATSGVWNPFLASTMKQLGYSQPFDKGPLFCSGPTAGAVGFDDVEFDAAERTLLMPAGIGLDLGGIAKGFAADLITAELLDAGAWGAMVSLGGDLRVRGLPPVGLDWAVTIGEDAIGQPDLTTVHLPGGGVATSTTARRRWAGPDGTAHHLVNPTTLRSAASDAVLTSVIAGDAWWAEVCATALTIDPTLELANQSALQVSSTGELTRTADFHLYERAHR